MALEGGVCTACLAEEESPPLGVLSSVGKSISTSIQSGFPNEAFGSDGTFYPDQFVHWLVPTIVVTSVCILVALIGLVVSIVYCCCYHRGRCGGPKGIVAFSPPRYSQRKRVCAAVTLAVAASFVFAGIILGYIANGIINIGLSNLQASFTVNLLGNINNIPDRYQIHIGSIPARVNESANQIVDSVAMVPHKYAGPGGEFASVAYNLTMNLRATQAAFDDLRSVASSLTQALNGVVASSQSLESSLGDLSRQIKDLQQPTEWTTPGEYYRLDKSCLSVSSFSGVTPSVPNFNFPGVLSELGSFNLSSTGDSIDSTFASLNQQASELIDGQLDQVRAEVNTAVGNIDDQIQALLSDTIIPWVSWTSEAKGDFNDIYEKYVEPLNLARNIASLVILSLGLLTLLIGVASIPCKSTPGFTVVVILSFFLMILFWLLCALHLFLAGPLSRSCQIYRDQEVFQAVPESFLVARNPSWEGKDLEGYVQTFYDAVVECHAGGNLIEILNQTDKVQFSGLVTNFVDEANLTAAIQSIDLESLIESMNFTGGVNITRVLPNISSLISNISVGMDRWDSSCHKLVSSINSKSDSLGNLENNTSLISECTIHNVTHTKQLYHNISLQLQDIHRQLLQINQTLVAAWIGNITLANSLFSSFQDAVSKSRTAVDALAREVSALPKNFLVVANSLKSGILEDTIPTSIEMAHSLANDVTNTFLVFSQCRYLGDDWLAIVYSTCKQVSGGINAMWIMSSFVALSLVVFIIGVILVTLRWFQGRARVDKAFAMVELVPNTLAEIRYTDSPPPPYAHVQGIEEQTL